MICPVFNAQAKKITLLSYGIDNDQAYLEERKTALNYLQETVSCPNNNGLMCGVSRTTGTCLSESITSTPNNLRIISFTNQLLSRIDPTHLQYTATIEIGFDNPNIANFISSTLPMSVLNNALNLGVVTTNSIIGFTRIGVTNNWNLAVLITSAFPLAVEQYTFIGIARISDTLTNVDQTINTINTV
jgi:hypothetical protein